jgi:hypothetical protein
MVRAREQPSPGGLLKLAREGHPQASRLCIELIPPPCHEAHGLFCTSADREGGRCLYRDKRRILGGRSRHVHAGKRERIALVVETFIQRSIQPHGEDLL